MADDRLRDEGEVESARMSFGEHLEELRTCLIRALLGLAVGTAVTFAFATHILTLIIAPAIVILQSHGEKPELLALSPQGPFMLYMKVGFLGGLVLSAPWILYQFWQFVSAGLYRNERRLVKKFMPVSIALFAAGVAFMYYVALPIVLNFFVVFNLGINLPDLRMNWLQRYVLSEAEPKPAPADGNAELRLPVVDVDPSDAPNGSAWVNNLERTLNVRTPNGVLTTRLRPIENERSVSSQFGVDEVVSTVFGLALAFGVAFEVPIVVMFLTWTGIVSTANMVRARRYIIFGIIVAAAVLTPPDVVSQILLAAPMLLLFEGGLFVARRFERRRTAGSS